MDDHNSGGVMESHIWFPRFRELVLAEYTVTAIVHQLTLEGFDLGEFDEATLVGGMLSIIKEE